MRKEKGEKREVGRVVGDCGIKYRIVGIDERYKGSRVRVKVV
jgi:hypothetical protein